MNKKPDAAAWMAARGWSPFPFRQEVWVAMAQGQSGLLQATTGAGRPAPRGWARCRRWPMQTPNAHRH